MPNLVLTDDEHAALLRLVKQALDTDRYPLPPRLEPLKAILAKVASQPVRESPPPPRAPAGLTAGQDSCR
jgi:hypothetical protein